MDTSRGDFGIAVRSAFLRKGTQQRYSLFFLAVLCVILIFLESIDSKPLNKTRSVVKDLIYRGAVIASYPLKTFSSSYGVVADHLNLYNDYQNLKDENSQLKSRISKTDFLKLENTQLRKLIDEQVKSESNLVSARVILDKQSPYLNSFVINIGSNKEIKNGMAVLDGENFIGRIVDVNFFSSRVLLITDLNSKIAVLTEPSGDHAILTGHGKNKPSLDYMSKDNQVKDGDKVYTSGKEGIFSPGIIIGEVRKDKEELRVELYSDLNKITFINISQGDFNKNK